MQETEQFEISNIQTRVVESKEILAEGQTPVARLCFG